MTGKTLFHRHTLQGLFAAAFLASASFGASASIVAVFDDPAYVDTTSVLSAAESDTVQASITSLGHTASAFVGIDAAAFSGAIAGSNVLLFPEFENGALGGDLSAAAIATLSSYVAGGGGMIVMGGSNFIPQSAVEFLNAVFGFALVNAPFGVGGSSSLDATAAAGTAFEGGPASIPNPSAVHPIVAGLPLGSEAIYTRDGSSGDATVALIPFGAGEIAYLGWDWFNAAPIGGADGGWLDVLDRAIGQTAGDAAVPQPATLLLVFGVVVVTLARTKRARAV